MRDLIVHPEVQAALNERSPVVALESTVVAHGLPWPDNLATGRRLEGAVREGGATPATVAVISGRLRVGLDGDELAQVARGTGFRKVSRRDFPSVLAGKLSGATTVAGTMLVAAGAGIRVLATGGIGGVHRGDRADVSADLPELARTPVLVVCSGAKSILDLPATLEWLETHGVPVIGYCTDEFPAFYTESSGLRLDQRADTAAEVAAIARAGWDNGLTNGLLVCLPCPSEVAVARDDAERAIRTALADADARGVGGKALTPFLLRRVAEITGGASLVANLALLERNASLAAAIASALADQGRLDQPRSPNTSPNRVN